MTPTDERQQSATEPTADSESQAGRLPLSLKLAFGGPSFAGAAMAIPIAVLMPRFYSDVMLAPLGYVALAIALARSFDALTDPVMGWLSDRTRTRWGRRKPWIALGTPLAALAFVALFSPPAALEPIQAAWWFGVCFTIFFLFQTIEGVPMAALGAELTPDYNERSSLFGVRSLFIASGTMLAAVLPTLLSGLFEDERTSYRLMSGLYAVLWLLLMSIMLLRVRERPEFAGRAPNPLVPGVRRSLRNRPFRILLLAGVVNAIPAAIPAILLPYFVEYVLQPENPGRWVGLFLLLYLGTGLLFVPLWMAVARRVGKLATMITASAVAITGSVFYFFAGPGDLVFVSGIFFVTGTAAMAGTFLIPAMAADVIDYDELRTGKRREAQFTALWAIIPKFVAIPGSSIPLAVMAAVGYVPNQVQTAEVQITIRFLYSVFPAVFYVAALAILSRYPVSESIHNRVRDGIAARARGETAIDPLTQERLVPAEHTDVDEDTGWFLDHFSPRELARGLADGMHKVTTSVLRAAGLSLAACVASCVVAANTLGALDAKPGLTSVLAVVAAGFSFTLFVFHTVRLRPAHRLTSGSVDAGTISAHLRSLAGNDGE